MTHLQEILFFSLPIWYKCENKSIIIQVYKKKQSLKISFNQPSNYHNFDIIVFSYEFDKNEGKKTFFFLSDLD
jgi:hypothetical protein